MILMNPQQKSTNWEWSNPRIAKKNWIETLRLKISISIMNTITENQGFNTKEIKTLAMMNLMQDSTEISSWTERSIKGSMNNRLKNTIELENFRAYQTWIISNLVRLWYHIEFITSLKIHQQWKRAQRKRENDVNLCIFSTE